MKIHPLFSLLAMAIAILACNLPAAEPGPGTEGQPTVDILLATATETQPAVPPTVTLTPAPKEQAGQ